MVEPDDLVDQRDLPRRIEAHVHDIPLGGGDHHALDPGFVFERARVGGHDLHPGSRKREVQRPRVRGIGQIKAHHLAAPHRHPVARLAVHQKQVAEAAHQRVRGGFFSERNDGRVRHEQIVEHQHCFSIRWTVFRLHHDVAVQAELLLDVFAHVRVIPVDPRVGKLDVVGEFATHRSHAIERVVETNAVPMDAGGIGQPITEAHDHFRASRCLDQRSGILAVVAVHGVRVSVQRAAHETSFEADRVTVHEVKDFARPCERDRGVRGWKVRSNIGAECHLGRQHREPGRHGRHDHVFVMVCCARTTHRADGELEHIGRHRPGARRLATQNDPAVWLARPDAVLG